MATLKITPGTTIFRINEKPYQKGGYELLISGNNVGLSRMAEFDVVVHHQPYTDWRDENNNPFGSLQALIDYAIGIFFLDGRLVFSKVADNYSALLLASPSAPTGSLAYVYNSQGTVWLPGTLGGTYYPNGIYLFDGVNWISSRNAISNQLQTLIDNVASLQAGKADLTDPRFPTTTQKAALTGSDGLPSGSNKYVTDSDPRNSNARVPLAHTHIPSEVGLGNVPNVNATNPSNIVQDATHRFATDAEKATWNAKQSALGYTPENLANKGVINGYAGLDASGRVPAAQLPAYVDDVLEFATLAAFPAPGTTGIIYIAIDTDKEYRWTGTAYREISPSPGNTDAVPEGPTNLYFTVARVLATTLTGFAIPTNAAVVATDTILQAFGKIQRQINDILVLLPTAGQKDALVGNNGVPGAANRYVTESGLAAAFTQSGSNVTRTLNTSATTGFLVSILKYSYVRYVIAVTCSVSLSGSQAGDAFIEIAPTGTAAGGAWTIIDQGGFSWAGGLVIGLTLSPTLRVSLAGFVPPNFDIRIRFAGTGSGAYVSGRENILN